MVVGIEGLEGAREVGPNAMLCGGVEIKCVGCR